MPRLLKSYPFIIGIAVTTVTLLLGWGLPMILPSTPHNGIIITIIGLVISAPFFIWAYILYRRQKNGLNQSILPRSRRGKVIIAIGAVLILAGFGIVISQLSFRGETVSAPSPTPTSPTYVKQPNTVVNCCIQGNTYQVWAYNKGDAQDTVVVTLGTSGLITGLRPLMGASLPIIIVGGVNANFIVFKIDELPPMPNMSLSYLVETSSNAVQPREFTALSEQMGNISAIFVGECPKWGGAGPIETRPP